MMQILERDKDTTATGQGLILADTQAADEETVLASSDWDRYLDHEKWSRLINEPLIDWGKDPSKVADEGIVPPSVELITFALRYAMHMRDQGYRPPDRVVPNGDAGIAFERWEGSIHEVLEFESDGIVELLSYRHSRLENRLELSSDIP
jgi:hypothetical protein